MPVSFKELSTRKQRALEAQAELDNILKWVYETLDQDLEKCAEEGTELSASITVDQHSPSYTTYYCRLTELERELQKHYVDWPTVKIRHYHESIGYGEILNKITFVVSGV